MEKKLMKKFEEMSEDERGKLRQFLQENNKSKQSDESKLVWMYKGDKRDDEEYLLGRRIDSGITDQLVEEKLSADAPGAKFAEVMNRRADVDMQVKMREDPLYAIREEELKRRLLENPVRMKQLQKTIETQNAAKKSKKEKKKKKYKKKNKKRSHDSDDDDDDDDDDELLID